MRYPGFFREVRAWLSSPEPQFFAWLVDATQGFTSQGDVIRNCYHEMHVIQDMLIPLYKVKDALEWVHREMEVHFLLY
ncbi:hypothetical protein RJT34_19514 [Clitoria ternatea]|uniref:Uncharacterized protein n=1 Tax=Clitoria ternatea TaxID=43366 RepID=A0AAN9IRG0_CLITE